MPPQAAKLTTSEMTWTSRTRLGTTTLLMLRQRAELWRAELRRAELRRRRAQLQGQQQHLAYHGTMPSSKRPRVLRSRRWGWVRTQEFPQRKSWRAILLPPLVAVTGARRRCGR